MSECEFNEYNLSVILKIKIVLRNLHILEADCAGRSKKFGVAFKLQVEVKTPS